MKKARVLVNNILAGILEEISLGKKYRFVYHADYQGAPISLTLPLQNQAYEFDQFPSCFEGLLPEGIQLEALLQKYSLDKHDYFAQLLHVGDDLVGALSVERIT